MIFCLTLSAQEKGVSPVPSSKGNSTGTTRAVVVGISDYKDEQIPDLRYADRDAEGFVSWLRSPAGLSLPDTNLIFLKNANATTAQMVVSLDWLIESSQSGDRAFIYFSGHGDVERVTKFQRGFLLSYDSPPAVYAAGAFSLNYLQDILSSLSQNGVQVFVITDACHAGKLAGSSIGGPQATATQLSQQFANEIKVLSCQPDEFSLEGEQWGGGRGCFSYHLEDALYGFADANGDAMVDLLELRRYLEENVGREAAPQNQLPMVTGPVKTFVAAIRADALIARKAVKENQSTPFRAVDTRGIEDRLLAEADTSEQRLYAQFLAAIDSGFLLEPQGNCADDYFKMLLERPRMVRLHGVMRRKLAAALMDEGQLVINKILNDDQREIENAEGYQSQSQYRHLPGYFARAAEILGERHYVYNNIKAKELYFRSRLYNLFERGDSSAIWSVRQQRNLLDKAIELDNSLAILYYAIGNTYLQDQKERYDYIKKASELAPNWLSPLAGLTTIGEPAENVIIYKKIITLRPDILDSYGWIGYDFDALQIQDSASFYWRMFESKFNERFNSDSASLLFFDYYMMANVCWQLGEKEKGWHWLRECERISDGKVPGVYYTYSEYYLETGEYEKSAESYLKHTLLNGADEPYRPGANMHFYIAHNREKAVEYYSKLKGIYITQVQAFYSFDKTKALMLSKKAFEINQGKYFWPFAFYAGECYRSFGMPDSAAYYYQLIVNSDFDPSENLNRQLFKALAYHRIGQTKKAITVLESSRRGEKDPHFCFLFSLFFGAIDEPQKAIDSFRQAVESGWKPREPAYISNTLCDPMLDPIRSSTTFEDLVKAHFPKQYNIATQRQRKQ